MNAGIAIILFVSVAIIYMTIIDLWILLFRILGLNQEQARFQVISLWTNCGYTTSEAEIIVNVPSRRRLARMVMLFGNIFSVTIISLFVNAILTLPRYEAHEVLPFILGAGASFVAFLIIRRKPKVRKYFDDKIILAAEKRLHGKQSNSIILLDELSNNSLSKVILNKVPKSICDMPISKLGLEDKGIHPLYYLAPNQPIELVNEKTKLHPNTSLTVIGPFKAVKEFFVDHLQNETEKKDNGDSKETREASQTPNASNKDLNNSAEKKDEANSNTDNKMQSKDDNKQPDGGESSENTGKKADTDNE